LYALSSFVISRGGANSLCEIIALKKPCVCIPLSKATRGDQIENAKYYESKGAIIMLDQNNLTLSSLFSSIDTLAKNKDKFLSSMKNLNVDGTNAIVENIRKRTDFLAKGHEF
jgi:UDP-N-acetylglucosamine--N-acetylmuramyl-(pentapeptide) pyrophosphoryl-undecaprenol N-acetylglucosamine transferase